MHQDRKQVLERIRAALIECEKFPTLYVHKFIGANTENFERSVERWKAQYSDFERAHHRLSASGKHVAHTFEWNAQSADQIIERVESTFEISDLLMVL